MARSDEPATVWGFGDYHRFARETVWPLGQVLVDRCGVEPGQRVLDVAAGSGNTAIRAAEAGAEVVASDIEPASLAAGRREAESRGLEIEWVEADAQDLPFADSEFDLVTSSFGAIFAPDHRATADQMVRVCRSGGTIGMLNFTPEGLIGDFFSALEPYAPPPEEDALPPPLWGDESHVRDLFDRSLDPLRTSRGEYVERATDPAAYRDFFKQTFGPVVAIWEGLADDPDRRSAFDRDFLEFARRADRGPATGPSEYHYEYLLVLGVKAA